jgi:hypothetical protein
MSDDNGDKSNESVPTKAALLRRARDLESIALRMEDIAAQIGELKKEAVASGNRIEASSSEIQGILRRIEEDDYRTERDGMLLQRLLKVDDTLPRLAEEIGVARERRREEYKGESVHEEKPEPLEHWPARHISFPECPPFFLRRVAGISNQGGLPLAACLQMRSTTPENKWDIVIPKPIA